LVLYLLLLALLELLAITCLLHHPWRSEYSSTSVLLRFLEQERLASFPARFLDDQSLVQALDLLLNGGFLSRDLVEDLAQLLSSAITSILDHLTQ
jgi:hypothetical protein